MWRSAVLLLALTLPAAAQFSELAATDDGSQIFLSTSLRLGDAAPSRSESRVYRLTPSGVELFAERGALVPKFRFGTGEGAGHAQVSGDGRTVAITLRHICPSEDPCFSPVLARSELRGARAQILGDGYVQLSRNGRWALLRPLLTPGGDLSATLIDLETNTRVVTPPPELASDAFGLTSDGAVLVQARAGELGPRGFGIWRGGQVTLVRLDGPSRPLGLSDDGGVLLYSQLVIEAGEFRLIARQLSSGKDTTLFSAKLPQLVELMGVSSDGRRVLFRTIGPEFEGTAFLADSSCGGAETLTLGEGELAVAGTLGGSGDFALISTTRGRLVKFPLRDCRPDSAETVISATPYVSTVARGYSPGSRARLRGSLPFVREILAGRILLDERPVPILAVGRDEAIVQIPWELSIGYTPLRLDLSSDSPFRQRDLLDVTPYAPEILTADPGETSLFGLKIIKGDWSGLVTATPGSGEIVHVYFTGLGAVSGPVSTGVPAPIDRVLPIQATLRCRFLPYTADAATLFAGLAPGLIGIYQVSFRMPNEPSPPRLNGMTCEYSGPYGGGSFGLFSALAP